MSVAPPQQPPAGWYPDPSGNSTQRWWDGRAWSEYTTPASSEDRGTAAGPPTSEASGAGYGSYRPRDTPLAPSGMRRVSAMFAELGRIIRRAWLAILGLGLIIWAGWTITVGVLLLLLVDFTNLIRALAQSIDLTSDYPSGEIPAEVATRLSAAWSVVPRTHEPLAWVIVGVSVVLATFIALSYQLTATNQLGLDAAADQEVRIHRALRTGWPAAWRVFGYLLGFTLVLLVSMTAIFFLFAAAVELDGAATPFLVTLGLLLTLAMMIGTFWAAGRLIPLTVQVLFGGGALSWCWRATRGRFWAVFGRFLLWNLIASFVIQLALTITMIPLAMTMAGAAASGNSGLIVGTGLALVLLIWPATLSGSAISYLGVVPIWRDLTDHPEYRAIDESGLPVPTQSP